jgi:hypothetical protein
LKRSTTWTFSRHTPPTVSPGLETRPAISPPVYLYCTRDRRTATGAQRRALSFAQDSYLLSKIRSRLPERTHHSRRDPMPSNASCLQRQPYSTQWLPAKYTGDRTSTPLCQAQQLHVAKLEKGRGYFLRDGALSHSEPPTLALSTLKVLSGKIGRLTMSAQQAPLPTSQTPSLLPSGRGVVSNDLQPTPVLSPWLISPVQQNGKNPAPASAVR